MIPAFWMTVAALVYCLVLIRAVSRGGGDRCRWGFPWR